MDRASHPDRPSNRLAAASSVGRWCPRRGSNPHGLRYSARARSGRVYRGVSTTADVPITRAPATRFPLDIVAAVPAGKDFDQKPRCAAQYSRAESLHFGPYPRPSILGSNLLRTAHLLHADLASIGLNKPERSSVLPSRGPGKQSSGTLAVEPALVGLAPAGVEPFVVILGEHEEVDLPLRRIVHAAQKLRL